MQYANNGSLLSYLSRNINMLTWKMKLNCLMNIARNLSYIHRKGLVHCNLHGRNIVLHNGTPFICDLGSSRSMKLREPNSNIRGDIPFIAPEVFHTRKFTQKSDVYSFGIIMYLMATGEPPFRNRKFDASLIRNIMDGLRPQLHQRNTGNLPSGVGILILISVQRMERDFFIIFTSLLKRWTGGMSFIINDVEP